MRPEERRRRRESNFRLDASVTVRRVQRPLHHRRQQPIGLEAELTQVERHRALLDRRLPAAVVLLDNDLHSLHPLERVPRGQQRCLLALHELRPAPGVDHPLVVVRVGKVRRAVHRPLLRMLPLHVAVARQLVLELGLGDRLELGFARPLVGPPSHLLFDKHGYALTRRRKHGAELAGSAPIGGPQGETNITAGFSVDTENSPPPENVASAVDVLDRSQGWSPQGRDTCTSTCTIDGRNVRSPL
jgi:hypothetical protein